MKKVKTFLSIGYPGACHEDEIELEDDATEEEIEAEVIEWANNYIDISWEVEE